MIKTVVFDFADTIAKLVPSKELLVQSFIKEKLNLEIPIKRIEETYFYIQNLYFYSSVQIKDSSSKSKFYQEYNRKIFSNLGVLHLMEPFLDEFFEYFLKNKKHWILKEGVLELFKFIQAKDLKIGLISNFDTILIDILDHQLQIRDYFSYVHISQDIGLEKPNPDFYVDFLTKHNLKAEEILYIGDNYELDYLPSSTLGFKSVLLDEKLHYIDVETKLQRVNSLLDVKSILF